MIVSSKIKKVYTKENDFEMETVHAGTQSCKIIYLETDRSYVSAVHHTSPASSPNDVAVHFTAVELALEGLGVVPSP